MDECARFLYTLQLTIVFSTRRQISAHESLPAPQLEATTLKSWRSYAASSQKDNLKSGDPTLVLCKPRGVIDPSWKNTKASLRLRTAATGKVFYPHASQLAQDLQWLAEHLPPFDEPHLTRLHQAQTPQQRKANLAYARSQEAKMGKPQSETKKKKTEKPPISRIWICETGPVILDKQYRN